MSDTESITIYSDYVCPFCYLGRESLAQYQAEREDRLEIDWHPFDLRAGKREPDGEIDESVDDGKDEAYFEQARQNVRRLAERYDADMELELSREVDSLNAQIASYHVKETEPYERWLAFDVAIFEALWEEGRDVGDPDVLAELADDVGIDPAEVRAATEDEETAASVTEPFETAQRRGVTGVPTFTYDGYSARGAVPPEHLQRLVEGV